ncbi:MAG: DUF169 domain-containing protein [Eubacteriales bacterium]|nr:DUF169 domain-containing protein [Clostridiales bacterium]MDY5835648.1 DUF169 domain-containing protein [Eubacteriales bacterium]
MYKQNEISQIVQQLDKALPLQRLVVGVQFLFNQETYTNYPCKNYTGKLSFCQMVRRAMDNESYKYNFENFTCRCAAEALGLVEEMDCVASGERYFATRLHISRSVAKQVQDSLLRIHHRVAGIVVGPLETLEAPDLSIIVCNTFDAMRIIQGYAYVFGPPRNISTVGNQGFCCDLAARPYETDDLNISFLCAGTRFKNDWATDEVGIAMPINKFIPTARGVIQTLNPIENRTRKQAVADRLSSPDELGITIDYDENYGKNAAAYCTPGKLRR